jgi:hypothetical protein
MLSEKFDLDEKEIRRFILDQFKISDNSIMLINFIAE